MHKKIEYRLAFLPQCVTHEKDFKTALTAAFTYPILVKANRSATLLPGEGFHVPIHSGPEHDVVEIDPRKEAPAGLITAHIQKIENETVYVQNMSSEPVSQEKCSDLSNSNQLSR